MKSYPENAVVNEKGWVGKIVIRCIFEQDFLLESDLSRGFYPIYALMRNPSARKAFDFYKIFVKIFP